MSGKLYFPKSHNLQEITRVQEMNITLAVMRLRSCNLPHDFFGLANGEIEKITVLIDHGMRGTTEGHSSVIHPYRVLISPTIGFGLISRSGLVENNQHEMSIIIHELTHLAQMRNPIKFAIGNLPGINIYMNEKWANENQQAAYDALVDIAYGENKWSAG